MAGDALGGHGRSSVKLVLLLVYCMDIVMGVED